MKRAILLSIAVFGGLAFTLALVLLMMNAKPGQATSGVHYVASSGDCGGVIPCYTSIQAAVDAAVPGDQIRVAAGTYTDIHVLSRNDITSSGVVTQVLYISKTVTLRGGYTTTNWTTPDPNANHTVLDAQGQGRVFYITGDINPIIEGIRITGGDATGMGGVLVQDQPGVEDDAGGGMYVVSATVTISNSQVFSNVAGRGGGIYLGWSPATLINNTISANSASTNGGGVFLDRSPATLANNAVSNNEAGDSGGGFRITGVFPALQERSTGYLRGNTIISNSAAQGGGLSLFFSKTTLAGNTILSNTATAGNGGGLLLFCSDDSLDGNIIKANDAERGGGLFVGSSAPPVLTNNVVVDNHARMAGNGIFVVHSLLALAHSTIANNSGPDAGVHIAIKYSWGSDPYPSNVTLTNTIMVSHSIGISVTGNSTVTMNGVLWYNTPITVSQSPTATVFVQNQVSGDPAFTSDGYHITPFSPAMDSGVNAGVATDLDGHMRPFNTVPDIGADEVIATRISTDTTSSLVYTDTQGVSTAIQVPAGAVSEPVWLSFTPLLGPLSLLFQTGPQHDLTANGEITSPVGLAYTGKAFNLDVYQEGMLLPDFQFNLPVTITLGYTDTEINGIYEGTLVLEYWVDDISEWEDAANTCTPPSRYDRHLNENWLAVPICHLSHFALFGSVEQRLYLPLVLRNY